MTEPKFSIGDRVAVCCLDMDGWTVFPETVVDEIELTQPGDLEVLGDDISVASEYGWHYGVEADSVHVYAEDCLRKIGGDEYDETPTTTERGISA